MERRGSKLFARLCTLLLAVALLCAVGVVALAADNDVVEPVCYTHGDVNGDGVIDNRDAIYTLYHSIYGDEKYPVEQDWDFNSDGEHSNQDAIYVLYAALFSDDPDYQLKGLVHSYYDPAWEWSVEEDAWVAQVSFKCGCGEEHVFVTEEGGISVVRTVKEEATCLKEGTVEYVASIEFEGQAYTNTKTERIPVLKHEMDGFQSCDEGAKCKNCDYTLPALGHAWEEKSRTEASCTARAVITYACKNCRITRNEETGEFADHVLKVNESLELVEGCKVTEQLKCENCPMVVDGTVHYEHNYVANIVPATCVSDGSKTYVCDKCQEPQLDDEGNPKTEILKDANAHNWVETAEGSGIFHCHNDGCGAEKKTVNAVDQEVSKTDLEDVDEMKLSDDGAAMAVDSETLEKLNVQQTIQVTVTPVDVAESGLSAEQQAQIPGGTVYNFEMKVDGTEKKDFDTPITISLPYTPEEGEDLEAIDVWYIDDDGNAQSFKGTYSNGFVTFTTTHFSYYTVTRMTPAERCERYGHIWVATHKDPTCTEDGYDLVQCQRCGKKDSDEKLEKTGHNYKETVHAATCTEEGSVTKLCQNEGCKSYLLEKLPALGHKMEKNTELSVDATCEATGKEVHTCTREGCDKKTETVLAQLAHSFKLYDEKDPDCVNKGHKQNRCEHCGKIETEQEKAPTGHDYLPENAVWTWSDDHKSASVTLICSYNSKHTKKLTAVVSSETKAETSCLGSGAVEYTAVAQFNKAEFTNTVTVTQAAAGHKPGSSWSKDESNHWHVCSVCNEKTDIAFHNWDEGKVITAPTCAEEGESLYTCTACGQEKTVTVKATGAHDYHFGVCKNCGFGKSTCTHEAIHQLPADMSQYGLCEGTVFYWIACDCGENKTLFGEELGCELGEAEIRVETDEYGQEYEVEVYTCPDCGLVGEVFGYLAVEDDACMAAWTDLTRIMKNGEVLIEDRSVSEYETYEHPNVINKKVTDLTKYGLCGMTVYETVCPCGESGGWMYNIQDGCSFEYTEEGSFCVECGAEMKHHMEPVENDDPCTQIYNSEVEVYFDGELIYSYEWTAKHTMHDEKVLDYELTGTSCEEGLQLTLQCVACGESRTVNTHYHETVISKETDLSGYDICAEKLIQYVCPCGARKSSSLVGESSHCNWDYYDLDNDGEPEHRVCMECGATHDIAVSYGEKNEWCGCIAYATNTYRDKNGKQIAVSYDVYDAENHDIETTVTLLGDTCEDGVLIVEACKDCDLHHEREEYWHYMMPKTTFDLSAFDMCATKGVLYGCLCGEEEYFDWVGGRCQWQWIDGHENGYREKCSVCGIEKKETYQKGKATDPCHTVQYVTLEFSRDGVSLGKFSFEQLSSNHIYVAEFELMDEAAGCAGGVRGTAKCLVCGDEMEFETGEDGYHPVFIVDAEIICQEGLCGTLLKVKSSCACGQEAWENIEWSGTECRFDREVYSQELDCWVSLCSGCGAERIMDREQTSVEGTTCMVRATEYAKIYKNGQLLCEYDTSHTYEEHTTVCTFELLGSTCEDGYYITRTCAFCDYSYRDEEAYYDHDTRLTYIQVVCDNEDICGPVYVRKNACACGMNVNASVDSWNCNFEHVGFNSQTGEESWRCRECGLERVGYERVERTPGSCDAKRTMNYVFKLNGEMLGEIHETFDVKIHDMRYSFRLEGQSCEDGFCVSEQCKNCAYSLSQDWLRYGHEWFTLETYDLADYGMCGGRIQIDGCACGKERGFNEYVQCNWESTGNYDPATGLEERICRDCGSCFYMGTVGQVSKEDCRFIGNLIFKLVQNGQTVLDVSIPVEEYRHNYKLIGANFDADRNCNSGVTVLMECVVCGATNEYHIYYHETFVEDYIDLAEAGFACGGELRSGSCACGQETFLHWGVECANMTQKHSENTDANGITHYQTTYECPDCGLKLVEQWYDQKIEGCNYVRYETVDVYQNGQIIKTLGVERKETSHSLIANRYTLAEGSVTCEDGVIVDWTCAECGENFTGETSYHGMNEVSAIDLTQYGSICGGELILKQCACGEYQRYDFSDDCKCDVSYYGMDLWISDAINGDQPNVDDHVWLRSYAERIGCGVTDPTPCGLGMARAIYWKVENCIASEYQTWRLGYDETTGTWDKEITIKTGEQVAWHDYQHTSNDQRVNGTGNYTWREECADCGSFREVIETWDNDQLTKRTEEIVNNLNFGRNRRHYVVDENGLHVQSKVNPGESFWMPTKSQHTWTRMDGSVFEEGWTRDYDFTGECKSTTAYWNSDGGKWTETGHAHTIFVEWEVAQQATCTQYGEWVRPCRICGTITEDERQPMQPTMHNFNWSEDKQKYVCTVCDLESVRSYSGSIAMEELSNANDADHKIGYWNRDEIEFMPTVSVILYDVNADELDELVLTGIEFTYHTVDKDGFTGLSFNKAAAQAAADAAIAEAGYSGSYGIRISFVPLNTQDELDYAITFDTQTTAE